MSTVNVLAVTRRWRDLLLFAGNADDLEATHEGAQELRQRPANLGEPSGIDLRGEQELLDALGQGYGADRQADEGDGGKGGGGSDAGERVYAVGPPSIMANWLGDPG